MGWHKEFNGSGMPVTAPLFCKPCLANGHQCPAREGEWEPGEPPVCIFCEDGAPCPAMRRAATAHTTQRPSCARPVLRNDSLLSRDALITKRAKGFTTENTSCWRVDQRPRIKKENSILESLVTPTTSLRGSEHSWTDGEPRVAGCAQRDTGQRVGRSQKGEGRAQGAERQGVKVCNFLAKGREMPGTKQAKTFPCKFGPECKTKITERNASGYCAKHFYVGKLKGGTPKTKRTAATPKAQREAAKVAAAGNHNGSERTAATLLVSEQQLDHMFTAWPLEDKVGCVQLWLDRLEG
jgi:hypothetical protein